MPGQVKAIIPAKFNTKAVLETLEKEFEKYAPFIVKDLDRIVRPWKGEKPEFKPISMVKGGAFILQIRVVGSEEGRNKFKWLNEGTRPHKIKPKGNYPLRFRTGYGAGSKPKSTFTFGATAASGPEVFAREVNHPGFPAREWTNLTAEKHQRTYEIWMERAMKTAAGVSGHEIKK
jgi:hypothetical protein